MKPIKSHPRRKRDEIPAATAAPAVPEPAKPMSLKEHYRSLLLGVMKAPIVLLLITGKFTLSLSLFLTRSLIRQ
jgi:hypothetical protein